MGWNGSDYHLNKESSTARARNLASKNSSKSRMLLIAGSCVVAVALVIGILFFIGFFDDEDPIVAAEAPKAEFKPNKPAEVKRPVVKLPEPTKIPVEAPKVAEPKIVKTITNSNGAVIQDLIMPDGKTKRVVTPPKPIWDNAADQVIAFAISIEPGVSAPPLPAGISDDEFRRALKKKIVINPDDPPHVKDIKERVKATREELLAVMNETGKTFEQVLNEHRDEMNLNTELYYDSLKGLKELEANGTPEEVDEYIRKANELLRQRGAKELPVRTRELNTVEEQK